jgi:hypothetical protein
MAQIRSQFLERVIAMNIAQEAGIRMREFSRMWSSPCVLLGRARIGTILRNTVKIRQGLVFAIAATVVFGVVWVAVKLAIASGSGLILALLRDAGHQVGAGGLPGAGGAAGAGASGSELPPLEPLKPGQYRTFSDDGMTWTYTPDPSYAGGYQITGQGPGPPLTWGQRFDDFLNLRRTDEPDISRAAGWVGSHEAFSTASAAILVNCPECTTPPGA